MSLAPEFAPEVFIPERARRSTPPGQRRAQRPGAGQGARALLGAPPEPTAPSAPQALATPGARPHRVSQPRRRAALPIGAPVAIPLLPVVPSTGWTEPRRIAVAAPAREPMTLILRRTPPPAAAPALSAPALRLTRRGAVARIAAVVLIALGIIAAAWLSAPSSSSSTGGQQQMPAVVTVEAGDTLWSLASELAPGSDPRELVSDLRRINGLDSVALQPGQVLRTR